MNQLNRKLTLYGLTMIAVGSCIGSGIFVTPGKIAREVPDHGLILIVWAVGGLIALTGSLTLSEVGSRFPGAGGVYVYLREAFGDLVAFLYGWVILLVVNTGALAALGLAFTEYLTFFVPLSDIQKIIVAIILIWGLTGINAFGVNISQEVAKLFTGIKLLAIIGIVLFAMFYFEPMSVELDFGLTNSPERPMQAVFVALIGVLWSMGGWHHASYLAGEAINPRRTVPWAMVFGVLIVTIVYILINFSYMLLLPLTDIAATERVAGDALESALPGVGGYLMSVVIALSIFGTVSIYTMSAPRIYFAMAKDGNFFQRLAVLHPRYKTPAFAMFLQAFWATILVSFWGTFHDLISYVTFMDIAFMTLAGISLFVFRFRKGLASPSVRVPLYPIIPLVFIFTSSIFLLSTIFEQPQQVLWGTGVLLFGIPVFYYFKKQSKY